MAAKSTTLAPMLRAVIVMGGGLAVIAIILSRKRDRSRGFFMRRQHSAKAFMRGRIGENLRLPVESSDTCKTAASCLQEPTMGCIVLGDVSVDLKAVVDIAWPTRNASALGRFTRQPGGRAANQAIAIARLGTKTQVVGRVGDDDDGRSSPTRTLTLTSHPSPTPLTFTLTSIPTHAANRPHGHPGCQTSGCRHSRHL